MGFDNVFINGWLQSTDSLRKVHRREFFPVLATFAEALRDQYRRASLLTSADLSIAGGMKKAQFEAELIEGHKGVVVVLVPFDPEEKWSRKPVLLAGRRHGWPVVGTANGVRFEGYIGERWNRFFIIIDSDLRHAANVSVGDTLKMSVEPTSSARVLELALKQSRVTTAPKSPRTDAIPPAEYRQR